MYAYNCDRTPLVGSEVEVLKRNQINGALIQIGYVYAKAAHWHRQNWCKPPRIDATNSQYCKYICMAADVYDDCGTEQSVCA